MSSKPIIFLDMDGVLFDFVTAFGTVLRLPDIYARLEPGVQDIPDQIGVSQGEMWEEINQHKHLFWEEMPVYPWFDELVGLVEEQCSEWYILSSPARSSESLKGKLEALKKAFGERFRGYIFTPRKSLLANSNRILIDDQLRHCAAFEKNGGQAILFPRLWNQNYAQADQPVAYTRQQISKIVG